MDYKIPTSEDLPPTLEAHYVETPQEDGPMGARGIGEHTMIPTPAAIANALYDACGIRIHDCRSPPRRCCGRSKSRRHQNNATQRPMVLSTCIFDHRLARVAVRGEVAWVFSHATVARTDDGSLLTLLHPDRPLVPYGAVVAWDETPPFAVGDQVTLWGRGAPRPLGLTVQLDGDGQSLAIEAAPFSRDVLAMQPKAIAVPSAVPDEIRRRFDDVLAAFARDDEELGVHVRMLSGLGPGSTPTGDDLLVGMAAMAWRLKLAGILDDERAARFFRTLDQLPPAATTPIAREMIRQAALGHFVAPLRDTVMAIGNSAGDKLVSGVEKTSKIGASTGNDLLVGAAGLLFSVTNSPAFR